MYYSVVQCSAVQYWAVKFSKVSGSTVRLSIIKCVYRAYNEVLFIESPNLPAFMILWRTLT